MRPISAEQERLLREAYDRGDRYFEAAARAKIGRTTAWRRYRRFDAGQQPRAPRPYRSGRKKGYSAKPPRYTGPDWIGKRIAPRA